MYLCHCTLSWVPTYRQQKTKHFSSSLDMLREPFYYQSGVYSCCVTWSNDGGGYFQTVRYWITTANNNSTRFSATLDTCAHAVYWTHPHIMNIAIHQYTNLSHFTFLPLWAESDLANLILNELSITTRRLTMMNRSRSPWRWLRFAWRFGIPCYMWAGNGCYPVSLAGTVGWVIIGTIVPDSFCSASSCSATA